MVTTVQSNIRFQDIYAELQRADQPQWLSSLRRSGLETFESQGIPDRKHEEYKYTNLQDLTTFPFVLARPKINVQASALDRWVPEDAACFVFVDGFFSPALSRYADMAEHIEFCALSDELLKPGVLKQVFKPVQPSDDVFDLLNTALFQDGVVLKIKDHAEIESEIHIVNLSSGQPDILISPRHWISIGQCTEVSLVQTSASLDDQAVWTNARTEIQVAQNSQVRYTQIQADNLAAYHIHNTHMQAARDSQIECFTLTTGGRVVRNNFSAALDGPGIDMTLNCLSTVRGHQHVDHHTVVDHRAPHCMSSQLYKNILADKGRTVFNGKIFVRQAAQQTNAYQLNRNLLLSGQAEADTKPQLEIFADDVRCTHGATVGPIDDAELFYLQSRGMTRDQAISLMSHGFAEDVLATVSDDDMRNHMRTLLVDFFDAIEGK
ncbi:MAG: Fe-S cluster assembly protein SufD [Phycisphaerae bacterium]|nr:Fe-S cluster assembly protein SufD [Phycisphaerae bacterium]